MVINVLVFCGIAVLSIYLSSLDRWANWGTGASPRPRLAYNLGTLQPALTAEALTGFIEEVKPQYIVVPTAASLQIVDHTARRLYSHGAYAVFG